MVQSPNLKILDLLNNNNEIQELTEITKKKNYHMDNRGLRMGTSK